MTVAQFQQPNGDKGFRIGDECWVARLENTHKWVECPECCGQKALIIIMGDGTHHALDCEGCKRGYLPPSGYVETWEYRPIVEKRTIIGVRMEDDHIKYDTGGHFYENQDMICSTEELARVQADLLKKSHEEREADRIKNKVKQHRSWSWHVHYYRREIREHKRRIEYAERCLDIAKLKSKEPADAV